MAVYCCAMGKGGSVKTTTTAELALRLAGAGRRVLALDMDRQGNLSTRLGVVKQTATPGAMVEVLKGEATVEEAAVPSPSVAGVDVVKGTEDTVQVDYMPQLGTSLLNYLPTLRPRWDDIVMDTPANQGVVTLAALAAAEVVIAPVDCAGEAYEQVAALEKFLAGSVSRLRPGASVDWVVPCKYEARTRLGRDVVAQLTKRHGAKVTVPVRRAQVVKESYVQAEPVGLYAPRSKVAADYAAAIATITNGVTKEQLP